MMERWARVGSWATAVVMFGVVGFFTWSELTDPRRGETAVATAVDDDIESPEIVSGTYTRSFDRAGLYDFVCTIHPLSMRGRVIAIDG